MKQRIFDKIREFSPKVIIFLLLAALALIFLPNNPGSYAAYSADQAIELKESMAATIPATLLQGEVWSGRYVDTIQCAVAVDTDVNETQSDLDDHFTVKQPVLGIAYTTQSINGADDPETGVAGDSDKLPQTDGISPSTFIGLLGLALMAAGGTIFTILRNKRHQRNS